MTYFNFNGKILPGTEAILGPESRGLRYGDGIFETMRCQFGKVFFYEDHYERLQKGIATLNLKLPAHFDVDSLQQEIISLTAKNKQPVARIRVCLFRQNGGLYEAQAETIHYTIETYSLEKNYSLNSNGLDICLYKDAYKACDILSNIKHNNFLVYALAAIYAKEQHCNDALILNEKGHIADSTIANIFWVKDEIIYTNPLAEGIVAGVFRKQLLKILPEHNIPVVEGICTPEILEKASEIFLTNVIRGCRWVKDFNGITYTPLVVFKIMEILRSMPNT